MAWLRRNPLAAFLPLQAVLYLWNLALLSPWMDEAGTLIVVGRPLPELLRFAAADVHPPLYYLLLFGWQRLPLGLDWTVQARALSVIFALLGTVALDRLWGSRLGERGRMEGEHCEPAHGAQILSAALCSASKSRRNER